MSLRRWMARLAVRLLAPQQVPSTVDADDWLCGQDVDEVHGDVGVGSALASEQVAPVLLDLTDLMGHGGIMYGSVVDSSSEKRDPVVERLRALDAVGITDAVGAVEVLEVVEGAHMGFLHLSEGGADGQHQ